MHLTIMLKYLKIPQIPGLKMWFFCPLCLENNDIYFITVQVPVKDTDNPNNPTLRSTLLLKTVDVAWFAHSTVLISIILNFFPINL